MYDDDDDEDVLDLRAIKRQIQESLNRPHLRALRLSNELDALLLECSSANTFRFKDNRYGISIYGYKLGYSVCGFFCTQVMDIYANPAALNHPLAQRVSENSTVILDFVSSVIENDLSKIDLETHKLIKELIRGYEAGFSHQGETQLAFIFREANREYFGNIDYVYTQACYIATYVYSDYNAPEVKVLRRFRDERLARNRPGRILISVYYFLSQRVLAALGRYKWFNRASKALIARLYQVISASVRDGTDRPSR